MDKTYIGALYKAERLMKAEKIDEAASLWRELICHEPDNAVPYYGLGTALCIQKDFGAAIPALTRAVEISPGMAPAWCQLGNALKITANNESARNCYRRALETVEPTDLETRAIILANFAGAHVNRGEPEEAIRLARESLATQPNGTAALTAKNDLALGLLEAGQWREGWQVYENRRLLPHFHRRDYGNVPQWDGKGVGTLAIHAEQGIGDEILFASCIKEAMGRANRVVLEVNPRLVGLFRRSFGIECFGTHEELRAHVPNIDAWDSLGSLPRLFRPSPDACPGTPYIHPDLARVAGYRERLRQSGPGPYIGFAFKGGTVDTHAELRKAPDDLWSELIANAPGTAISVQYGTKQRPDLIHWPAAIGDLDEFAALTAALDCVVSIPQTAVHFAGAIGIPCLVANPYECSWQFSTGGDRMNWYRSVEIVRQPTKGAWQLVFDEISTRLRKVQNAESVHWLRSEAAD